MNDNFYAKRCPIRQQKNQAYIILKKLIILIVFAGCCVANAAEEKLSGTPRPAPNNSIDLTPSQVFNKVKGSVVVVKTFNSEGENTILGSGVLLPNGKIGTNCHVVKNGVSFQVGGGKKFVSATLWGGDENKDICLLEAKGLKAKPAQLGQATRLKVGDAVYAVGAPEALELSLSNGIISQLRGGPPPFIQTTAAISHGSSGGGLFDAQGRLVGFTTLYIEGGQSLNFAMPVEWAGDIQAGKKLAQGRSEVDWNKQAIALESAKNWAGLLDWCQQWTRAHPEDGTAWFALGEPYGHLKRYSEAIEAYNQALRINPDDSKALVAIGGIYLRLQRYTEAIDALSQAVRIDPEDANGWGLLAFSYKALDRYADAIEASRRAVRIDPEASPSWFALGGSYFKLQRYTDAIEAFSQTVRIDPDNADAWGLLAISYKISGNLTAALEAVQQLRRLDPAQADELFNLIMPR